MARRKVGDRVKIKSRYFNAYNEMEGVIIEIEHYHLFIVELDEEWSVDSPKIFYRDELTKATG